MFVWVSKILLMTLLVIGTCTEKTSAIQFSQMERVGCIGYANMGGFFIEEATYNYGKNPSIGLGHKTVYDKGTAKYSNGMDALYFHYNTGRYAGGIKYDKSYSKFGAENIENTIQVDIMMPELFKISSDENITLYVIKDSDDLPEENSYMVIGRRADGVWVKYIDTKMFVGDYLGRNGYDLGDMIVENDIIRLFYKTYDYHRWQNTTSKGEFCFKWDDAAQWFSIEQIIY